MPPKASVRSASKGDPKQPAVPKKANAHQIAVDTAVSEAQKLFKQHEEQRIAEEQRDKAARNRTLYDETLEKERLRAEEAAVRKRQAEVAEEEALAFQEYAKHEQWAHVPDASRLPDVHSEKAVNSFLSVWRDEEKSFMDFSPENAVVVTRAARHSIGGAANDGVRFIRGEQGMPVAKRSSLTDRELAQCMEAYELTRALREARDQCIADAAVSRFPARTGPAAASGSRRAEAKIEFFNESLRNVSEQILSAATFVTANAVSYYDVVLDAESGDRETLTRALPAEHPVVKYGLWVKTKDATRSFTTLVFPGIEVRLDPKTNTVPKLPKPLGLSRENVALRTLQLAFDPFSGYDSRGKEYYAVACTLNVELLEFEYRPRDVGEWQMRSETAESRELRCQEYPPRTAEARVEDPAFRLSFEIPHTVVIRQPSLLVGKWLPSTHEWEPCSHLVFGAPLGGGGSARAEANIRRATFTTGELAHFAVLQERTFDAPFEQWCLYPVSYDQVVFAFEGRHRGDASDRSFRVLVENAQCKLLSPDDEELERLRSLWLPPATLFRELADAGFNFLLHDEDARFLEGVVPKSVALEHKAYADIAQYAQFFSVASTRHNKHGEDPDMALFRLSKEPREVDEEKDAYAVTDPSNEEWHHVRYHSTSCVISAFTEEQDSPDLNVLKDHESHFDLYSMLLPLHGQEVLNGQLTNSNFLLRRCVLQILHLVRPLSWG